MASGENTEGNGILGMAGSLCTSMCAHETESNKKKIEKILYIFSSIKVVSWEKSKLVGFPYTYFMG